MLINLKPTKICIVNNVLNTGTADNASMRHIEHVDFIPYKIFRNREKKITGTYIEHEEQQKRWRSVFENLVEK